MPKAIPDAYGEITPYLRIRDAAKALTWYKNVFGAVELYRIDMPGDKVGHAELKIGSCIFMISDEFPDMGIVGPETLGGSGVALLLYVEDCDTVVKRAVVMGAKLVRAIADQFYGDRSGNIVDPFGHQWTIATHKEDVSPEEMNRRTKAMFGG
jgi:PhnB protein